MQPLKHYTINLFKPPTQQETVKAHHLVDVICSPGSVDIPMYGRHWFAAGQYVNRFLEVLIGC